MQVSASSSCNKSGFMMPNKEIRRNVAPEGRVKYLRALHPFFVAMLFAFCALEAEAGTSASPTAAFSRVVSINLCTDQMSAILAAPGQLLSVSWLAHDPNDSVYWEKVRHIPGNYGAAEEILVLHPQLVLAGTYTTRFTVALLRKTGIKVVEMAPPTSLAEVEENWRSMGRLLHADTKAAHIIKELREGLAALAPEDGRRPSTLVYRAGGFTSGGSGLIDELMTRLGLENLMAQEGSNKWGEYLSMEEIARLKPELVIIDAYRFDQPSLANDLLAHPAVHHILSRATVATIASHRLTCGTPALLDAARTIAEARRRALMVKADTRR
jgi:iron complex transport system substrate-binding protein